jgi:glycine/D-amino acid oxidase-like deaminating enzyme
LPRRSCPETVAIVGGGLAGLATAYHLLGHHEAFQRQLQRRQRAAAGGANSAQSADIRSLAVTVYDTHPVGTGGASAVAGGYVAAT